MATNIYSSWVKCSPELLSQLKTLRLRHLRAVDSLLSAINQGAVRDYLDNQFKCPAE